MTATSNDMPPRSRRPASPTWPPPSASGLSTVLERNIQSLSERRRREEAEATVQERVAETITRFTGSMIFVYIHLAFFGFWIVANLGWIPGVPRWDESFVVLAMWASVEAIFLSTFVLISQNRMAAAARRLRTIDGQPRDPHFPWRDNTLETRHDPVRSRPSMPCPTRYADWFHPHTET